MFQTKVILNKRYDRETTSVTYELNGKPCSAMLIGVFWTTEQAKEYLKQLRLLCKQVKQVTS